MNNKNNVEKIMGFLNPISKENCFIHAEFKTKYKI